MVSKRGARPILVLAALFLLGLATGVFGTIAFVHDREARSLRSGPKGFEERRMRGLARRLDLDDAQRVQVRALLEKTKEENRVLGKKMMEECGAPIRSHHESFEAEMKKLLRPEQAARFVELENERRGVLGDPGSPPPFP